MSSVRLQIAINEAGRAAAAASADVARETRGVRDELHGLRRDLTKRAQKPRTRPRTSDTPENEFSTFISFERWEFQGRQIPQSMAGYYRDDAARCFRWWSPTIELDLAGDKP